MAMSEEHKKILQRNYTKLISNISEAGLQDVVNSLYSKAVITETMMEAILAKGTRTTKIEELLSILPRRGDKAFDTFHEVLVEKEETVAADLIKPPPVQR